VIGLMVLAMSTVRADEWANILLFPRGSKAFTYQVHTALMERAWAGTNSYGGFSPDNVPDPPAPTWWRSQRTTLKAWKDPFFDHQLFYVFANEQLRGSNDFVGWMNSLSGADLQNPFQIMSLAVNQYTGRVVMATLCHNPSNYFQYTPYRMLSGIGNQTNDPTVGRPHGYTNANTAKGVAAFLPPGRTAWYTTDYGWSGITGPISNLRAVIGKWGYGGYGGSAMYWHRSGFAVVNGPDLETAWTQAREVALTNVVEDYVYTNWGGVSFDQRSTSQSWGTNYGEGGGIDVDAYWHCVSSIRQDDPYTPKLSPPVTHLYVYASNASSGWSFHPQGTTMEPGWCALPCTNVSDYSSGTIGDTNQFTLSWPDAYPPHNYVTGMGWRLAGFYYTGFIRNYTNAQFRFN
jgi:hypothetical protein